MHFLDSVGVSAVAAVASAVAAVVSTVLALVVIRYMHRQTEIQRRFNDIQTFYSVSQTMEGTRTDRQLVRDYVNRSRTGHRDALPKEVVEAMDRICRAFDTLGMLERTGFIDSQLVDLFYSVPFVLLYEQILGDYVAELQKPERRGPTHLWELVQFYDRVKHVAANHPGLTGSVGWPSDPRKPRGHVPPQLPHTTESSAEGGDRLSGETA